MADTIKNISIKYSQTGMAEMTRQVKTYNDQLGRVAIGTQKLNNDGAWTTIGATTKGVNTLSSSLNSVMMRFIGLNAIINMGTQAYQELREWIDASVVSFRSFEYKIAEVSSILDSTTRDTLPSLEVGISQLSVKFGKSVEDMSKS
jgi:hypothetical protein